MNPTTSRALLLALALGVALTHLGCSYELILETVSGRTRFELGETVVIEVFDGKERLTEALLDGATIRWSVRNQIRDSSYRDLGSGDALITSQLEPGRNWIYADIDGDTNYALRATSGGISIEVTENGVLPAPPEGPTPTLAPDPQPAPATAPAASPATPAPDPAPPTGGLIGGLGG